MGLIDSHTHLTLEALIGQIDAVLDRCAEAGVDEMITVATDLADARRAMELAARCPGRIHVAAGFHPHEADRVAAADLTAMADIWHSPAIVGIGEMGLDYHYDFADRDVQRRVFARQLELAEPLERPIVIHCREALDDTIALLCDHGYERRPVVFHCFTGTQVAATRIADHGWRISFTGIVTFRKSTELQAIAKAYPADALMIETDAPYLTPEPVRNKRPNEPAFIRHTARFLAELRGISLDELTELTARNTRLFFGL